ncbi:filamentous hemagglutinin N-terminal domain-containing protein [Janthinobacterium sp.]|uniref:two-partner secretion domain-containing protein n=1 Tax=Janthinobacterium sp. TaxID=1871054 RepID=UPI00293D3410|nr:filamentous hemagglutinin N-terminal domain-containing protein [Janthinobacterium sp.]
MKTKPASRIQRTLMALLVGACFGSAGANPVLPQVILGQAAFAQQGNVFSITNSPNAIINWQSFSVNPGELTRFFQQSASSSVLNRVTGQDPSRILGALQSNGRVFLINPNGVLFGRDARVDVQGLVASSLNISNADFQSGKNNFTAGAGAGKVSNQGSITTPAGGQVFLIAPNVDNSGIITSSGGAVVLAAGHSVQLVDSANPGVHVVLSAPGDQAINLGQIIAQGGRIGIYGALLNQRGNLNASGAVRGANGTILLKASGTALLEAGSRTTAAGGAISVLGARVGVTGDASIDASGRTGGGTVLIGGDYQGGNGAVPNAQQTYVGPEARIAADAIDSGNGGKVIVWSDLATRVFGRISARGGAQSGAGGLVETSGHYLDVHGIRVDAGAPKGQRGKWLLDPYDINIVNGGAATLASAASFYTDSSLEETRIDPALLSGATADVVLQARHDLSFSDAVSIAQSGVGLTAQAGNNINVNAPLATRGGALNLFANDNSSGMASGFGQVSVNSALRSNGGAVMLSGAGVAFSAAGSLSSGSGPLALMANKMMLGGLPGSIAGMGGVSLLPGDPYASVQLGNGALDSSAALGLDANELRTIATNDLMIGGNAITLLGPLDLMLPGTLRLIAGKGPVTQMDGAAISGVKAVWAQGSSVSLTAANITGVVGGVAEAGNFQFHSVNQIFLGGLNPRTGGGGIKAVNGDVTLVSDSVMGISQGGGALIMAKGLELKSAGPVYLPEWNAVSSVAADLNQSNSAARGTLFLNNGNDLAVDTVGALSGINSRNFDVELSVAAGHGIALNQAIAAGSGALQLTADALRLSGGVTAKMVDLTPATKGLPITVGSACVGAPPCLALTDLARIAAPTIGIGGTDPYRGAGNITVAGIAAPGSGSLVAERNPLTTRIGLLTRGSVTQTGAIDVQDLGIESLGDVALPLANRVRNLAANVQGGFTFNDALSLGIGRLTGGRTDSAGIPVVPGTPGGTPKPTDGTAPTTPIPPGTKLPGDSGYDLNGITAGGIIRLSSAGAIVQSGGAKIRGDTLMLAAAGGIGSGDAPLLTQVAHLSAENSATALGAPINIKNNGDQPGELTLHHVAQTGSGNGGAISVNNSGKLILAADGDVSSGAGSISLVAHSPLLINGSILSTSGDILLEAGASGSPDDVLSFGSGAKVTSGSGNIALKAGAGISVDPAATLLSASGTISKSAALNTPPVPPVIPPVVPAADPVPIPPNPNICTIAPTSALCQALAPPSQSSPAKPVTQATNAALNLIAANPLLKTPGTTEQTASAGPVVVSAKPDDKKADEKKSDTKDSVVSKDSGAKKDEAAKKTYCN